jgi:hypothetical protein
LTEKREIRKFGGIALILFGVLSAMGLWRQKAFISYFFGLLSFLGLCFLLLPEPLNPVYEKWLKIGRGIGRVMTAVMLTLAYYLVITPTALIKRLFGGNPIPTSPDQARDSYWVQRSEPAQPRERFLKRY